MHPLLSINTKLPDSIVDQILSTIQSDSVSLKDSVLHDGTLDKSTRSSKSKSICSSSWIAGFIYYYIQQINYHNFQYDILSYDKNCFSFICYHKGDFYHWHTDDISSRLPLNTFIPSYDTKEPPKQTSFSRKISFTLQLNDDYEGGELQIYANKTLNTIQKRKGELTIFDSRLSHRVKKVKSGIRKSIVGWIVGPRWK